MSGIADYIEPLEAALIDINYDEVDAIFQTLKNFTSVELTDKLIYPALRNIGDKWEKGIVALAQMYMAAKICEDLLDNLILSEDIQKVDSPKIAIVVLEDYHGLGKKILTMILHTFGYSIIDYGIGTTVEELIQKIQEDKIEILLISTLMLRAALKIKELKEKMDELSLNTKLIVGGAPFIFDTNLWKTVGADAFGANASEAIELIKKFSGGDDS